MRLVFALSALFCLLIVCAGCNHVGGLSLSPATRTTLVPEDKASDVMKEQNYQAVTQAIAQQIEIKSFLDQQPELAKKTFGGKTLLFDAAFFGNVDAAQALLDHGADINFKTGLGETALDRAMSSKNEAIIALFQKHGAVRGTMR